MKQLQKNELKIGEIYKSNNNKYPRIFKYLDSSDNINEGNNPNCNKKVFFKNGATVDYGLKNITKTTLEEKHWLETCIKEDKFISYEEAMKSFVSEFVLPEKWYVKVESEQESIVYKKFFKKVKPEQSWQFLNNYIYGFNGVNYNNAMLSGTFITFEQFKQYVLKETPKVTEVLEEPKDKILVDKNGKYIGSESSEGGIYKLGDKITPFHKDSPNKDKPFIITGFRWNNAKTEICAITELHKPNGIRLSQIELYVEPKKELSFLEQVKLRYPIGTKFKNAFTGGFNNYIHIVESYDNNPGFKDSIHSGNAWIVHRGQWAEIVEEVDDFVLPEKWCIECNENIYYILQNYCSKNIGRKPLDKYKRSIYHFPDFKGCCTNNNIIKNYKEITFDQFKKYVLKDE